MSSAPDGGKKRGEAVALAEPERASDREAPPPAARAWLETARAAGLVFWLWIAGTIALLVWLLASNRAWLAATIDEPGEGRYVGGLLAVIGLILLVLGLSSIAKRKGE